MQCITAKLVFGVQRRRSANIDSFLCFSFDCLRLTHEPLHVQTNVVIVRPVKKTLVIFRDFSSALSELVYSIIQK